MSELFPRRPREWQIRVLRVGLLLMVLVMWPWIALWRLVHGRGSDPCALLWQKAEEVWRKDPAAATALLRDVHTKLSARGGLFGAPFLGIEVPPYGRFRFAEAWWVHDAVYRCELALGRHDEALAMARALPETDVSILQQVDCLLAMNRRAEAVALLESKLHLDTWVGPLRKRLRELTWPPPRSR